MKATVSLCILLLLLDGIASRKIYTIPLERAPMTKQASRASVTDYPKSDADISIDNKLFGPIYIGSAKTKMNVLYDTGSPWLWVNDVKCSTCDSYGFAEGYDCSKSTTCKKTGKQAQYDYGIGSDKMNMATDNVAFDGGLKLSNFLFGLEYSGSSDDDMEGYNGICGMGLTSDTTTPTVMQALKQQGQIEHIIFSIDMNPPGQPSTLVLGGLNHKFINTAMPWWSFKMSKSIYWETTLDGVALTSNGAVTKVLASSIKRNIFDSGTNTFNVDGGTFKSLLKTFNSAGLTCAEKNSFIMCNIPSSKASGYSGSGSSGKAAMYNAIFPAIQITIQGQSFTLEAQYYVYNCWSDNSCQLLITNSGSDSGGLIILGSPFFLKYYISFYEEGSQILVFQQEGGVAGSSSGLSTGTTTSTTTPTTKSATVIKFASLALGFTALLQFLL